MIRLTKSGTAFICLLVFLYVISVQAQSGLLFLLIGIVLGCYLVNLLGALRSVKKVCIDCPKELEATENRHLITSIVLNNSSRFSCGMIEASGNFGEFFKCGLVPPGSEHHIMPQIVFKKRGIYDFSELELRSAFPFGLVSARRRIPCKGRIIVYPMVYNCVSPKAAGYEPMIGGTYHGKHKSQLGDDFAGVRPYYPGDSIKSIHWKSSSKGQGIMVKEFNEELSGRISVIIDCSVSDPKDGEKLLDWAVRAAGSIIFAALDKDCHVELIDLNALELMHNPSFTDGEYVLEALAKLTETENCLNRKNVEKALDRISKKSAICFVVTKVNNEFINKVEKLISHKRVVSVYAPIDCNMTEWPRGCRMHYYEKNKIIEATYE